MTLKGERSANKFRKSQIRIFADFPQMWPIADLTIPIMCTWIKCFKQYCGSGSGQIRNILPDPDRHPAHADPDPADRIGINDLYQFTTVVDWHCCE